MQKLWCNFLQKRNQKKRKNKMGYIALFVDRKGFTKYKVITEIKPLYLLPKNDPTEFVSKDYSLPSWDDRYYSFKLDEKSVEKRDSIVIYKEI